jgi:acetylornithine/succinyldiaminopimelate/putrescine aminotransferase
MAPGFVQVRFNDIKALAQCIDEQTAAVILETIPATLGIAVPSPQYFSQVRELCTSKNVLLIIDEVQSGLGRTGKLWGIEHFCIVPDIMVIGKGLSGGIYPMSATCFRQPLEAVFRADPFIHVSTFGGAEVGCPVAMKVLEMSASPTFLQHVTQMAQLFTKGLEQVKSRYPQVIVAIRQLGLMIGIEMVSQVWGPRMTKACYESGLLCIYANNNPAVLQLLPPLVIQEDEVQEVLDRLERAFFATCRQD